MRGQLENLDLALPDDLVSESFYNLDCLDMLGRPFRGPFDSLLDIDQFFAHEASSRSSTLQIVSP